MRKEYTVRQLAKAFGVSPSGYYAYLKRPKRVLTERDWKDKKMIQKLYNETGGTYGAKRIAGTLKEQEKYVINHKRVARLMDEMCIKAKVRKKKTTQEKKQVAAGYIYPNLLKRDFNAFFPNHKWAMDVTEITFDDTKIYVSTLIDLFNREPIGFQVGYHSDITMMEATIRQAMEERQLKDLSQVTIHTDQGNVYRSYRYRQLSRELKFTPSMSRKGNCYDNALVECFFSHLKVEFPLLFPVSTIKQLLEDLPKYALFFAKKRSQKRLGYLSPSSFLTTYCKGA
ncbi:IS3 family transposase [Sporosarcina pasteurii]|uniref:IS2 transposase TnpB n=1 Tax=Sporosarcina pasteurii TaxID=1474 RepID=A0A380CC10_SPOPA|nr:IS3 family transposase [Sporosarcina pasteurii]MDS9473131.1 IS3 family transposase [Sporosarcina pasteurii]MDS9473135.1 IS3 family transposase [Sporosarcina pasteurii]SUJ17295.1 IS2 transposase TnpB [Sporosarcina pasteurii]